MASNTTQKVLDKPFSEVVLYTSEMIIAQCYKEPLPNETLKQSIIQGLFVKITSSYDTSFSAFGIITKINNTSLDNIHKPSALGLNPNELEVLQPQVYDLLRKELEIYLFAHSEKDQIHNYPPLKPLMVHDFVYKAPKEDILELTNDISNIISLTKRHNLKIDLLYEPIYQGYLVRNRDYNYLLKSGQELVLAYEDDLQSLTHLLKRLQGL